MRVLGSLLLLELAACGFNPRPENGALPCDNGCPTDYYCATDGTCWRIDDSQGGAAGQSRGPTGGSGAVGAGGIGGGGAAGNPSGGAAGGSNGGSVGGKGGAVGGAGGAAGGGTHGGGSPGTGGNSGSGTGGKATGGSTTPNGGSGAGPAGAGGGLGGATTGTGGASEAPGLTCATTSDCSRVSPSATCCDGSNESCDGTKLPSGDGTNSGEFVVSADGLTVTDTITGLVWQRDGSGTRTGCSGSDKLTCTWEEARAYCASLTLGGVSGWRLPARMELLTIVDFTTTDPPIDPTAFPNTPADHFWTSSAYAGSASDAWGIFFAEGQLVVYDRSNTYYVRCVR